MGTLFALPWYLTWFGHSLNSYRSVVRLYDYFLASPFLLPIYVTAAIVLYREDEIFKEDCDMASMHCVLSKVKLLGPFINCGTQALLYCFPVSYSVMEILRHPLFSVRYFMNGPIRT